MENHNHPVRPAWVVGARGLVHEKSLQDALEFLDIPKEQRSSIVRDTVRASVEVNASHTWLLCVFRLRFSHHYRTELSHDDPQLNQVTNAVDPNLNRKRKAVISKESIGSTLQCWSKIQPVKNENSWTNVAGVEAGKLQLLAEYSTSDS